MTGTEDVKPISKNRWYWGIIVFILIYTFSMYYANRMNITEYSYDSKYYWNLANDIFYNGYNPIYIFRYPKSVRGYLFPVLVGYFKAFFNGVKGWRVLASLSMAACFSFSLPLAIKGSAIRSFREMIRTLMAYAVYMWIWGNLMQYPLSDFFSFFFLVTAIALIRLLNHMRKIIVIAITGIFTGIFIYAAYNTRTTFLYAGILVLLAFILLNWKNPKTLVVGMLGIFMGMAITAFPQCHINNRIEGCFTPKVYYDLVDGEVYRGIYTARYETFVGEHDNYPVGGVIFRDPAGYEIIRREEIDIDDFHINQLFDLFLKYPLDIIGIYVRHFVSLMTPVYRQAYLTDVYHTEPVLTILSILFWLIAGYGLLVQIKANGLTWNSLLILAVCIPALLQIFDEPELRFFLPIYVLCYYYVFAVIDYKEFFRALKANWFPVLVISLLIFLFWISMTSETLAGNQERHLLLSDNSWYYPK